MKICSKCKIKRNEQEFWQCKGVLHSWCKFCQREDAKKRYHLLKKFNPEKIKEYSDRWRNKNRVRANELSRKSYKKIRYEVLCVYGGANPKCACCGESNIEFLSFDHMKGGGLKHQRTEKYINLMLWLRRNNYPKGFQILCHNCNFSKGHYGYCPHKKGLI